jgi:hypothetical protein
MQWFPMDTAPRDGTPVLAARNNDLFWEYTVVWWHDTGTTGGFYPWQANNTAYPEERLDYWTPIKEPYMIEHDIDVGC